MKPLAIILLVIACAILLPSERPAAAESITGAAAERLVRSGEILAVVLHPMRRGEAFLSNGVLFAVVRAAYRSDLYLCELELNGRILFCTPITGEKR